MRRGGAGCRACLYHICKVLQQPARNNRQQRAYPLDSKTLRQPQAFLFQPLPLSLFNRLCCVLVSGAPEIRVRAFDVTAFLVYPAQAATTCEDYIATNSFLTDAAGNLSRSLSQVQIQATHHNLCLPHVHSQINPSSPSQISMSSTLPEVPRWTWTQH